MNSRNPQNRNILMKKRLREKLGKTETLTNIEHIRLNMPTISHNPCSDAQLRAIRDLNNDATEKLIGKKKYAESIKNDDTFYNLITSKSNIKSNSF